MVKIKGNVFITMFNLDFLSFFVHFIKSCLVKGDNPTHTFYAADLRVREKSFLALVCTSALLSH